MAAAASRPSGVMHSIFAPQFMPARFFAELIGSGPLPIEAGPAVQSVTELSKRKLATAATVSRYAPVMRNCFIALFLKSLERAKPIFF